MYVNILQCSAVSGQNFSGAVWVQPFLEFAVQEKSGNYGSKVYPSKSARFPQFAPRGAKKSAGLLQKFGAVYLNFPRP